MGERVMSLSYINVWDQLDLYPFQFNVPECRQYSARKGFFSSIIENIKEDMAKNKEMKDNIKKFREEAQKLENSEALMVGTNFVFVPWGLKGRNVCYYNKKKRSEQLQKQNMFIFLP